MNKLKNKSFLLFKFFLMKLYIYIKKISINSHLKFFILKPKYTVS